MSNLTLAEIRAKKIVNTRSLFVEDWGGDVYVKRLTLLEYARFQGLVKVEPTPMVDLVILFAANEDGTPLFTESDREFLENTPVEILDDIFLAGVELLNLNKKNENKEKDDAKN